jgi:hypothetical protein
MNKAYQISLKNMCFGIEAENDVIVRCAPIAEWAIGKKLRHVLKYYLNEGAQISQIGEPKCQPQNSEISQ